MDPLAVEYAPISPYAYVANNPVNAIDTDGRRILFVNGYWNSWIGGMIGSSYPGKKYWGNGFTEAAQRFFTIILIYMKEIILMVPLRLAEMKVAELVKSVVINMQKKIIYH